MKVSFKRNNFLISSIIIILLLVLSNIFQKEVRGFFYWFSSPIQENLWRAGDSTSDFFEGILNFASLNNKIDRLEEDNQGLTAEIIRLKEVEEENKSLRGALNIGLEKEYNLSVAKVISLNLSDDTLLINKGGEDNISKDMAVITENKVLVGIIEEVYDNFSRVRLASNKDMSFDVRIKQEEKEISAVAKGQGELKIALTLIDLKEDVSEGDVVVTNSISGTLPGSLLVGNVKRVIKNDVDPFQTAEVDSALNVGELKNVFIING